MYSDGGDRVIRGGGPLRPSIRLSLGVVCDWVAPPLVQI